MELAALANMNELPTGRFTQTFTCGMISTAILDWMGNRRAVSKRECVAVHLRGQAGDGVAAVAVCSAALIGSRALLTPSVDAHIDVLPVVAILSHPPVPLTALQHTDTETPKPD